MCQVDQNLSSTDIQDNVVGEPHQLPDCGDHCMIEKQIPLFLKFCILKQQQQQKKTLTKVSHQCLPRSRERLVPFPGKANPENALHKGGHQIYPGFSL